MPTYRSITLSLVSQFDILTIPEYAPPTTTNDPFSNAPTLINPDHSLVSVYIPIYPASQFWLSYSISPPHPPQLLYYFKLYINSNLIVSWGCGEEDGYKGKTMFGLFNSSQDSGLVKQSLIERRVLCFRPEAGNTGRFISDNLSDVMAVKVFRSKSRKRTEPDLQEYQSSPGVQHVDKKGSQQQAGVGINLVNAGFLSVKNPKRFYKYTLLDPLDQPFATFRYYYRSWDQLEAMGVISPTPSIESSSLRSQTRPAQSFSRRGSDNTLSSLISVAESLETIETKSAISTILSNTGKTNTITEDILATITDADDDTRSSVETDDTSLQVLPLTPIRLRRPPTPPPLSTPSKALAQLPSTIPATINPHDLALNTLTPKESFATLIRARLPSPDAASLQLKYPSDGNLPCPPNPPGTPRAGSMGAMMSAVFRARSCHRKVSESTARSIIIDSSEESLTTTAPDGLSQEGSEGSGSLRGKDRSIKNEKERKRRMKAEKKSKKGGEEVPIGRRTNEDGRKLHLWEEL